jgi:hypothetical protein
MPLKALLAQYLATYQSVAQIVLSAVAVDAGGMAPANADVVQHGRLFQKLNINRQFRVLSANAQTAVSHLTRVLQKQSVQVIVLRVVFVKKCLVVHDCTLL